MAKRFTDTDKWKKGSFGELSLKMKVVWIYLCDNCDHAGIWDANLRLLSFQVGEDVTREEISTALGDRVRWLSDTKLFLISFVEFQYGRLNPENRAHQSVISRLEKEGAYKVLTSPFQGAKDKDKEKEKEKDKEKEKESEFAKRELLLESIYREYPKRPGTGKGPGLKALSLQLASDQDFGDALLAARNYRLFCEKNRTEPQFIKTFVVWCGSVENPKWREWAEPISKLASGFSDIVER